eukprot:m51a1_g14694 hypothetical protein (172) ;mRNA; r:111287-111866
MSSSDLRLVVWAKWVSTLDTEGISPEAVTNETELLGLLDELWPGASLSDRMRVKSHWAHTRASSAPDAALSASLATGSLSSYGKPPFGSPPHSPLTVNSSPVLVSLHSPSSSSLLHGQAAFKVTAPLESPPHNPACPAFKQGSRLVSLHSKHSSAPVTDSHIKHAQTRCNK